jgi:Tfp pilus assembly protein PilZ
MIMPFTERRACPRFSIPGSMVSYGKIRLFGRRSDWLERSCLVIDLSRGGIRFLTRRSPSLGSKLFIELSWPDAKDTLSLLGAVRWMAEYSGDQFRYYVGVQFSPYGEGSKFNPVETLDRITDLERQFPTAQPQPPADTGTKPLP